MAPIIKKTNYRRVTTCRVNVPPILSLRKKEAFDFLISEQDSNPFLSSSDAESTSCVISNRSQTSSSASLFSSGHLFFPKPSNSRFDSPLPLSLKDQRRKYSKVQKKKPWKKISEKKKTSELIEYEKVISDCLREASSDHKFAVPLTHHSTPVKVPVLSTSNPKTPFSPIVQEKSVNKTSNDKSNGELSLTDEFSKLYFDENQGSLRNQPSLITSTTEDFYGFSTEPSLSDTQNEQEVSEMNEKRDQDESIDSGSSERCFMRSSVSMPVLEDNDLTKNSDADSMSSSNAYEDKIGSSLDDTQNKQEVSEWNDNQDQAEYSDVYTGSSLDEISHASDKNSESKINQNESRNPENMDEVLTGKQAIEEQNMSVVEEGGLSIVGDQSMSVIEEKELNNEESITESPCCEKESVIIICEQESLAEDDEDKSEDVSSALSSDQEAREGISSSDLESNSIDEEKEFSTLELRRHSFEKISPRKSCMIGPFSRRRCTSMVPSVLSQGSESYLVGRDHELSNNFHTNKHYVTSDNINDQSPKHSVGESSDVSVFCLYENSVPLDPLPENLEENQDDSLQTVTNHSKNRRTSEPSGRRRSNRLTKDLSPSRQSPLSRSSVSPDLNMVIEESDNEEGSILGDISEIDHFILPANKKYRRSLSIIRQFTKDEPSSNISTAVEIHKGRGYEQFVEHILKLQSKGDTSKATPTRAYRKSLSIRRSSLLGQRTPPRGRRASSRISSIPTSPISYRQLPLKRPSLSASILASCNRTQQIASSPFRLPLQPNQTLLQNISRYTNQETLKDTCLSEDTGLKLGIEGLEGEDYKDHVLILCEQKEPVSFFDIIDDSCLEEAIKVGEGVYGEVFMITRRTRKNVLKIIPIEGDFLVNGEKQKRYEEIYSELIIAKWLDRLRDNVNEFMTNCFAELIASWVIKGKYPDKLVELWLDYDERKGSDNDRPDIFNDDQLYLVLELGNAGTDLESYSFSTAKQALSIFKQTVFAVAVAEACFEFEHRDLHWGNVLISRTAERYISFRLNGKEYKVITNGVKSTIIDYTLSRITFKNSIPIYNDIGQDPDMFIATGDYQFDIYRHMKKDVCDHWDQFVPKTNVRWLHYIIDKMLKKVKYQRKTAKVHRDSIRSLQDIESWILNCDTSVAVALKIAEDN